MARQPRKRPTQAAASKRVAAAKRPRVERQVAESPRPSTSLQPAQVGANLLPRWLQGLFKKETTEEETTEEETAKKETAEEETAKEEPPSQANSIPTSDTGHGMLGLALVPATHQADQQEAPNRPISVWRYPECSWQDIELDANCIKVPARDRSLESVKANSGREFRQIKRRCGHTGADYFRGPIRGVTDIKITKFGISVWVRDYLDFERIHKVEHFTLWCLSNGPEEVHLWARENPKRGQAITHQAYAFMNAISEYLNEKYHGEFPRGERS